MTLSREQQRKVEENMGLVGKVIKDKVHGTNQYGIYSYDDLFQIGCIGLCKAAATDKGGHFSTYAYRLIWNEICDALIYANRRKETELLVDYEAMGRMAHTDNDSEYALLEPREELVPEGEFVRITSGTATELALSLNSASSHPEEQLELKSIIEQARAGAVPSVRKGIDAMLLMTQGYSCREIGEQMGVQPNLVTAWVSKARKFLRAQPDLQRMYTSGGSL